MISEYQSMMEKATSAISLGLARQMDDALKTAITKRLGRDDWTIDELNGRLDRVVHVSRGFPDEYWMDGELLLIAFPIEYSANDRTLTATRKFVTA